MSTAARHRISEDLRYELAEAAMAAERSNRPRSLLFLATAFFLVTGIALIVSLRQREAAVREFKIQSDWKVLVGGLEQQNEAVERLAASTDLSGTKPLTDLFTRIEAAAATQGLEKPSIPPSRPPVKDGPALKYTYEYTMRNSSLESLLLWIQQCQTDVPGLKVSGVEIVPQAKTWQCKVTFVRWERAT